MFERWPYLVISAALVLFAAGAGYLLLVRRRLARRPAPTGPPSRSAALITQVSGLSEAEAAARQVPVDREALHKAEWRRFRRQLVRRHLFTFYNFDMIGSAIAMGLLGSVWGPILSMLVLVLSFGLNVFQEVYTKRQLDRLVVGLQPQATVIRDGRVRSLPVEELVAGDVVVVGVGDRILVEGEIVGAGRIWVNEASDSGGMVRRSKQAGDPLLAGSICLSGEAVYRVAAFDPSQTALRQQELKASVLPRTQTPLQILIEHIFKILFVLVLLFNLLLFAEIGSSWLGLSLAIFDGTLIRDAVSQIFALAPTSLFLMIAVSYGVGLLRIADVGALVYRAETIEDLANTRVICFNSSDVLTGQQATLESIPVPTGYDSLSDSRIHQILGDYLHSLPSGQSLYRALSQSFAGNRRVYQEAAPFQSVFGWSAITFAHDDLRGTYILGDAGRLQPHLVADHRPKQDPETRLEPDTPDARPGWLKRLWPARRPNGTEPGSPNGSPAKTSGESVSDSRAASESETILQERTAAAEIGSVPAETGQAQSEAELPSTFKQRWRGRFRRWFTPVTVAPITDRTTPPDQECESTTLLLAYRPDVVPLHDEAGWPRLPAELIPLARLSLSEMIRPEVVDVVQAFVKAGVTIKILSANVPERLAATVKQLNLTSAEAPPVVLGADLAGLEDPALARTVQAHDFYARLTPDQQTGIVRDLRRQEGYVAVVGTIVNDIPAMQQATLRITAQSGSQATLTLADILLLDRSLTVLPNVLYRGQQIVNGLLDTFKLYLTHVAMHLILLVIFFLFLAEPMPYSSTQISIVSFFAITVPAIFLPFWASIGRVSRASMVRQLIHFTLPAALTTALLVTAVFSWYKASSLADFIYTRLVITHTLVAAGLVRIIFVKPPTPVLTGGNRLSGDKRPVWMVFWSAVLYVAFVLISNAVPTFQGWFDLDPLTRWQDYLIIGVSVTLWAVATWAVWRFVGRYLPWLKN